MHNQRATQGATSLILHSHMSQGQKSKNLHITGLESKLFFYGGVNQNSLKLQGGKDI